jgi:hypothetical protein
MASVQPLQPTPFSQISVIFSSNGDEDSTGGTSIRVSVIILALLLDFLWLCSLARLRDSGIAAATSRISLTHLKAAGAARILNAL